MGSVPIVPIVLALIVIGGAVYFIRQRRKNRPDGQDR